MQLVNWRQTAITGAVALAVALTAYFIENPSSRLVYTEHSISLGAGTDNSRNAYELRVWNAGRSTIEQVQLNVSGLRIVPQSTRVETNVEYSVATGGSGLKLDIPLLNAGERLDVIWQADNPRAPTSPSISLRGRGAIGLKMQDTQANGVDTLTPIAYGIGVALVILALWTLQSKRSKYTKLHDDIEQIFSKRPDAHKWLLDHLHRAKGQTLVDAMGVKVDVLYRILKSAMDSGPAPQHLTIRVLALAAVSSGAAQRARLEGHEKVVGDADQYYVLWPKLAENLNKYATNKIGVRFFDFCPAFYIVRIDDHMLVGTYLAGSGYDGLTLILKRSSGGLFDQFQSYFNNAWKAYE